MSVADVSDSGAFFSCVQKPPEEGGATNAAVRSDSEILFSIVEGPPDGWDGGINDIPDSAQRKRVRALVRCHKELETPPPLPQVPGYEILGEIAHGGSGVVYRARQVNLGRIVALKLLLVGSHASAEERDRFRREAEAVARLQHPHIVQIHEIGETGGAPYLALEYLDGGSLADAVKTAPLPPDQAVRGVETLCRAVHHAHEQGIVHRDLKPANILRCADGALKITDFGLARRLDGVTGPTQTGAALGTPQYMAPEQVTDGKAVGPAADVYGLGAILYELLTGRPPFMAATALETMRQVVDQDPVPLTRLNSQTPRDLETIALKCLEKDPAKRYGSAATLADDLGRFLAGQPILARPVGRVERGWKWCRRNRWLAAAVGTVAFAVATTIVVWIGWAMRLATEKEISNTNLRMMVDVTTDQGLVHVRRGDGKLGLHLLAKALQSTPPEDAVRAARGRELLAAWCPRVPVVFASVACPNGLAEAVAVRPDGRDVAVCGGNGVIYVYKAADWSLQWQLPHPHSGRTILAYSADGRRLLAGDVSGSRTTVWVWDAQSGTPICEPVPHSDRVTDLAFHPSGDRCFTCNEDGDIRVTPVADGSDDHSVRFRRASMLRDGLRIALACATVCRWGTDDERAARAADWAQSAINSKLKSLRPLRVACSPDGRKCVAAYDDGSVLVWDVASGRPLGRRIQVPAHVSAVGFAGADRIVVIRHKDRLEWNEYGPGPFGQVKQFLYDYELGLWDYDSGRPLGKPIALPDVVTAFDVRADGRTVLTAGHDGIRQWDLATAAPVGDPAFTGASVSVARYFPDGRSIVAAIMAAPSSGLRDRSPQFMNVAGYPDFTDRSSLPIVHFDARPGPRSVWDLGHPAKVRAAAWSADSTYFATACGGSPRIDDDAATEVLLWSFPDGSVTGKFAASDIRALVHCPTESAFAAAVGESVVFVKPGQGGVSTKNAGIQNGGRITVLAAHPLEPLLATGSADGCVRLWDLRSPGRPVWAIPHPWPISDVAFSADGRTLVAAYGVSWNDPRGFGADRSRFKWREVFDGLFCGGPMNLAPLFAGERPMAGFNLWETATGHHLGSAACGATCRKARVVDERGDRLTVVALGTLDRFGGRRMREYLEVLDGEPEATEVHEVHNDFVTAFSFRRTPRRGLGTVGQG